MQHSYNLTEKSLRRDIRKRLQAETDELVRGRLLDRLQKIAEGAEKRAQEQAKEKSEADSVESKSYAPPPVRKEGDNNESFAEKMEWYQLGVKEATCEKIIISPKSTLRQIEDAERALRKIESRRREISPDDFEMKSKSASPSVQSITPKAPPDIPRMKDLQLRERFSLEKFFRDALKMDSKDELIEALETEIRKRKMLIVWKLENTDLYVNEKGEVIRNLADVVFMGTIPNPQPKIDERPAEPTPTEPPMPPAETIRNRTRAYKLFDGTMFFSDGEVLTSIPMGVTVFSASDPPGYKQNSHRIPSGCVFDESVFAWRRR